MLKVDLKLMNNVIVGQVLEQDESLRGKGKILSYEKVNICSNEVPELDGLNLFIRGETRSDDNHCFCYSYDNVEEAKEYYDAFLKAIEKINEKDNALWLPKLDEKYYAVYSGDSVLASYTGCATDKKRFEANNVFKSLDFADKVSKSTKLHWLLWKLKERYCPDYKFILNKSNYILFYDKEEKVWSYNFYYTSACLTPYFDKDSIIKAAEYLNSHPELWEDLI